MKRFTILALAALLVVAFTVPAAAFESQFGGYWRTRFYVNKNFTGEDKSNDRNWEVVDTRTRLYYTAVLNDNLKFVNRFEWNAVWGQFRVADISNDSTTSMRWKHSYIDANTMGGNLNWKVGLQGATLGRAFLFADDFAGLVMTYKSDMVDLPFYWIKAFDNSSFDSNTYDVDYYAVDPTFKMGGVSLNPFFLYALTNNAANPQSPNYQFAGGGPGLAAYDRVDAWYAGLNADFNVGPAGLWFTGIYNGGTGEVLGGDDEDFAGYLLALGFNVGVGPADVHGQVFYATGDDDPNDNDVDAFIAPFGQSYYWSEIMGYGIFDQQVSNGSPADQISNITAYNLGAGMKVSDKLKATLDLWYANRTEDITLPDGSEENELGFEVDLVLTYKVLDGLNLDLVGAYLFAGDATTMKAEDDSDPYEIGARLSLSF